MPSPGIDRIHLQRSPFDYAVDVWMRSLDHGPDRPRVLICTGLTFKERRLEDEGQSMGPSFTISEDVAQSLADELWRSGFRPREAQSGSAEIEATRAHLDDMREIVAKKISVDLPSRAKERRAP